MTVPSGPQFSVKYTLTGPDGTVATFNETTDPNFVGYITEITGLDSPEVRQNSENLSGADGGVHGAFWYGRRPVTIQGMIINMKSGQERNEKLTKLKAACNAMRQDATLEWTPEGGEKQYLNLRLAQPVRITGGFAKEFQIPMVSADAYIYSVALQTANVAEITHQSTAPETFKQVCCSSDSKHAYAVCTTGNKLRLFRTTNALPGLEEFENLNTSATEAEGVCISPDGKYVYVTLASNKVIVYTRTEATGKLTLVEEKTLGAENKLRCPVVTADNKYFYVLSVKTTVTKNTSIFQCSITEGTGKLNVLTPEKIEVYSGGEGTAMAANKTGRVLAVNEPAGKNVYMLFASAATGLISKATPEKFSSEDVGNVEGLAFPQNGNNELFMRTSTAATPLRRALMTLKGAVIGTVTASALEGVTLPSNPVFSPDSLATNIYIPTATGFRVYQNTYAAEPNKVLVKGVLAKDGYTHPVKVAAMRPDGHFIYGFTNSGGGQGQFVDYRNTETGLIGVNFEYFTCTNSGNGNSYPIIRLSGGAMVSPSITNTRTGEIMVFGVDIENTEELVLDMRNRTVTLNGVSIYDKLNFSEISWFPLYPGANELLFNVTETSEGSPKIVVEWRNAWI